MFLLIQFEYLGQSSLLAESSLHREQGHTGGSQRVNCFLRIFKNLHRTCVLRKVKSASPMSCLEDLLKLKFSRASIQNMVPSCLMSSASKYPNLKLIQNEKNIGPVLTALRLMSIASGDYIIACSSDDWILPGFFEKSMKLLIKLHILQRFLHH